MKGTILSKEVHLILEFKIPNINYYSHYIIIKVHYLSQSDANNKSWYTII